MAQTLLLQLEDAGIDPGPLKDELASTSDGLASLAVPNLVSRMAREIGLLAGTEETVNAPDSLEALSDWKLELSSFLKELRCPHSYLFEGAIDARLVDKKHQLILIDYLLGELLAVRMAKANSSSAQDVVESSTGSPLTEQLKKHSMLTREKAIG